MYRLSAQACACLFLQLAAGLQTAWAAPSITVDNFQFISADPVRNPDALPIYSGGEYMDAGGTWNGMVEVTDTTGDTFRLTVTNSAAGAPDPLTDDVAFDISLTLNVPGGFRLPASPFTVTTAASGGDAGAGNCVAPGGGTITATQAGGAGTPVTFVFPPDTNLPAQGAGTPCAYTLTFGLTTSDVAPFPANGNHTLGYAFTYNEIDNDAGSQQTVNAQTGVEVRTGDVIVTKTAVPNPSDPNGAYADGETAEWTVSVFNNGTGGTFAVLIDDDPNASDPLNPNFDISTLQLTPPASPSGTPFPVPQGNSQYTIAYLEPGERVDITVQAQVAVPAGATNCPNLRNDVNVQDRLGNTSAAFDSVILDLQDPLLDYSPPFFAIDFGTPEPVSFTVTNTGQGTADNISLNASGLFGVTISNVAPGWQYDGVSRFSYTGRLAAGESTVLSFDAEVDTCGGSTGGFLTWTPSYENICGLEFTPPIRNSTYSVNNFPDLTIDKTVTPTTTNFGQPAAYTIDLVGSNVQNLTSTSGGPDWRVTDTLETGVENAVIQTIPTGTTVTIDNGGLILPYTAGDPIPAGATIIWEGENAALTPTLPSLTVNFTVTSTCTATRPFRIDNTAELEHFSCGFFATDNVDLLVNDSPIDSSDQNLFLLNAGPFQTGRPDTNGIPANEPNEGDHLQFRAVYRFPSGSGGTLAGTSFVGDLGASSLSGDPLSLIGGSAGSGVTIELYDSETAVIGVDTPVRSMQVPTANLNSATGDSCDMAGFTNGAGGFCIPDIDAALSPGSAALSDTTLVINYTATAPEGLLDSISGQPVDGLNNPQKDNNIGAFNERATITVASGPTSCTGDMSFTQGLANIRLVRGRIAFFVPVINNGDDFDVCGPVDVTLNLQDFTPGNVVRNNILIEVNGGNYGLVVDGNGDEIPDSPPPQLPFLSNINFGGTGNLGSLSKTITRPLGGNLTIEVTPNTQNMTVPSTVTFPVQLLSNANRTFSGTISYDSNHTSPDFPGEDDRDYSLTFSVTPPAPDADLNVEFFPPSVILGDPTVFADVDPGIPGDEGVFSWLVRITNTGDTPVSNYVFTNLVPAGFLPYSAGSSPQPDSVTGQLMVWGEITPLPALQPGESTQIRVAIGLPQNAGCNVGNENHSTVHFGCAAGTELFDDDGPDVAFPVVDVELEHLSSSYCELCGEGTVHLQVRNEGASNIYNLNIVEELGSSGLAYAGGTGTVTFEGGGTFPLEPRVEVLPDMTTRLVWDDANLGALIDSLRPGEPDLYSDLNGNPSVLTLNFNLESSSANPEDLVTDSRQIRATTEFDLFCGAPDASKFPSPETFKVPLHQPEPSVEKLGRNHSARQTAADYSDPVYGGTDDVVIWRVDVANAGDITSADLEDLLVNDTISPNNNFNLQFVCPTEADAEARADNLEDGTAPSDNCDPFVSGSSLDVDDPYGEAPADAVDVTRGGNAFLYFLGTINNLCTNETNNTDIEWGCDVATPAGGINADGSGGVLSAGLPAGDDDDMAELSTSVDPNGVIVAQRFTGTNPVQPVGTMGVLTITVTNNSGGTVRDLVLTDTLPADYELDLTAPNTLTVNPAFGTSYPGMTDGYALNSTNPNQPVFTFEASTQATLNGAPSAAKTNVLRNGDELVLTLGVIRVRPFDDVNDPEVRTENGGDGTDPNYLPTSDDNTVSLQFENTCGTVFDDDDSANLPSVESVNIDPEDIDVDIIDRNDPSGNLIFILSDPAASLDLDVTVRNNGGHDAQNYTVYVTTGLGLDVVGVPSTCSVVVAPPEIGAPPDQPGGILPPIIDDATSVTYLCESPRDAGSDPANDVLPASAVDIFGFTVQRNVADTTGDLTFRADVLGRSTLSDGSDPPDRGAAGYPYYSKDNILARIIGFNLFKRLSGDCTEDNPPPVNNNQVIIGEECTYQVEANWFGFATPGFGNVAIRNARIYEGSTANNPPAVATDPPTALDGQGVIGIPTTSVVDANNNPVGSITVTANPAATVDLDETGFVWTLSDIDTAAVATPQVTFTANARYRVLNDPANSAAPNIHGAVRTDEANARFNVFFPNDPADPGDDLNILFDENTAGYPSVTDRTIDVTITEPNVTITKEICNESVSIANNPANAGANCQPFVASPPNMSGDSDDTFIYRLTVSNEASAGGVARAPAYDVVINDIFDSSDQIVPDPFDSDGLDNDGDGSSDADAVPDINEGTVNTDLILNNGTPADITFDGTHSTALTQINAGDSVQLLYRARLDSMVTPTQQLTNTADGNYDSLPGGSGSQIVSQGNNGEIGGAREYNIAPVQSVLEVDDITISPGSKSFSRASRTDDTTPFGGTQLEAGTCLTIEPASGNCINRGVVVGEEVEVELEFTLPLSELRQFMLEDILPAGLECIEADPISLPAGTDPGFSPGGSFPAAVCDTNRVFWDLSTLGNQTLQGSGGTTQYTLQAHFIARVQNVAGIDNGVIIRNGGSATNAVVSYRDASDTQQTILIDEADLTVQEPILTVTKMLAPVLPNTTVDAADRFDVTVTIDNVGTSAAYNLQLLDTLDANLSFVTGSVGGANPPAVDLSTPATPRFNFSSPLPAGGNYTFTFQVQADTDVQPLEQLRNTIDARYTSLPDNTVALNSAGVIGADGAADGMRIGFLPPLGDAVNDYEAQGTDFEAVPPVTVVKNDLNPAAVPTIGARKHFQLQIDLPESVANGVVVNDNLAGGGASFVLENNAGFDVTYSFQDIVSINGTAVAGLATPADVEAVLAAFTATDGATGTVSWNFGAVITANENDAATNAVNPRIVIDYYARIANEPGTTAGVNLQNAATVSFEDGENGGAVTNNAPPLGPYAVVEPDLQVTKNFIGLAAGAPPLPVGSPPNTVIQGYGAVFEVQVTNAGTSAAWDVTVDDSLPNRTDAGATGGMCGGAPVITQIEVNGRTLAAGTDYTATFTPPASPADLYCRYSIMLTPTDSGAPADNARIEPGETLLIRYQATPDTGTPNTSDLTNVAGATEWFSLDTDGLAPPPETRRYNPPLTLAPDPDPGTTGTPDHQDAETVRTLSPILDITKSVINVTTGDDPALTVAPGETLRYTITINNTGPVDAIGLQITDEADALNVLNYPGGYFENSPNGSLRNVLVNGAPPNPADDFSDPNGGGNGSGLLDIRNQTIVAGGTLTVSFDIDLEDANTPLPRALVENNATVSVAGLNPIVSNTTQTEITRVRAVFDLEKTSLDITGDPNVLASGDTLRYTITIKNTGSLAAGLTHAVNTMFRDQVPANTTYVANSTLLNGQAVADSAAGVPPFADGMPVNSPDVTTPGFMTANSDPADTSNVARISFDVTVNGGLVNGTIISNQGLLTGQQQALAPFVPQPFSPAVSDDPRTVNIPDDPTQDVVGTGVNVDLLKTVAPVSGFDTIPNTGETWRYTIIAVNRGNVAANNVRLVDPLPAGVTYEANSIRLNGEPLGFDDGGVSPLIAGIPISSDDLTPPIPGTGEGVLTAGESAIVTFDVNITAANGVTISNQATVLQNEQPDEPSDSDGNDENGDQPTTFVVGGRPDLVMTKEVVIVGGGTAQAGGFLEYVIRVENTGNAPADNIVVTDTVPLLTALVAGSAQINGATAGVGVTGNTITADYSGTYGALSPGDAFLVTFRVQINDQALAGNSITNTADVDWNSGAPPDFNVSDSASVDVGGAPGVANINGRLWFDGNHDQAYGDATDTPLAGWIVRVHVNNGSPQTSDTPLAQTVTDDQGLYVFNGLAPVDPGAPGAYTLTFSTPDDPATFPAGANVALGETVTGFGTPGLMRTNNLNIAAGRNAQNESLPVNPTGIVYNSVSREAVQGARISLLDANGNPLPESCFATSPHLGSQQGQITSALGYYRFDLNFSGSGCPAGAANYTVGVEILNDAGAYMRTESQVIPPEVGSLDVAACPDSANDRVPSPPADTCDVQAQPAQPGPTVAPGLGTRYFLDLTLQPGPELLFNNHVPVDQDLGELVAITKETPLKNVVRGQLIPYTITVTNNQDYPIGSMEVRDFFPPGFKYVEESATIDGVQREPLVDAATFADENLQAGTLTWAGLALNPNASMTIKLLLVVGSGVGEAEYTNRAQVFITNLTTPISGVASATVRVVPDPTFDCSDIIGRVFDDKNVNGYPDDGEPGIAGARVVTAQGLLTTTDEYGRFHIACAAVPNPDRGSNFILKLDERTLPSGYRVTTENPRVQRLTRGKAIKFNFGAAIHRLVRLDLADAAFEPDKTEIRQHWQYVIDDLFTQLREGPSVLRITYLGDIESEALAERRVKAIKRLIEQRWKALNCCYDLPVETEVFWRTGKPGGER